MQDFIRQLNPTDPNSAAGKFIQDTDRFINRLLGTQKISLSPSALDLQANEGGADPSAMLTIGNSGPPGSVLKYQASGQINTPDGARPLTFNGTVDGTSGTVDGKKSVNVNVGVSIVGLSAGTYDGSITVQDRAGKAAPQSVKVHLTVSRGLEGMYTGTYKGTLYRHGTGLYVEGTLTLTITNTQQVEGGQNFSGNLQVSDYNGGPLSLPISRGIYAIQGSKVNASSDTQQSLIINCTGRFSGSNQISTIEGALDVVGPSAALSGTFNITKGL
jgi:hypothetical protein